MSVLCAMDGVVGGEFWCGMVHTQSIFGHSLRICVIYVCEWEKLGRYSLFKRLKSTVFLFL